MGWGELQRGNRELEWAQRTCRVLNVQNSKQSFSLPLRAGNEAWGRILVQPCAPHIVSVLTVVLPSSSCDHCKARVYSKGGKKDLPPPRRGCCRGRGPDVVLCSCDRASIRQARGHLQDRAGGGAMPGGAPGVPPVEEAPEPLVG